MHPITSFTHYDYVIIFLHLHSYPYFSFRKIKFDDCVRLKDEKATHGYWRFHHSNFRRGRPDLLTQIKRMPSHGKNNGNCASGSNSNAAGTNTSSTCNVNFKTEIDTLKKRIEEMNKNMTELTTMVQKVSIHKESDRESNVKDTAAAEETASNAATSQVNVGSKRKQREPSKEVALQEQPRPDLVHSTTSALPPADDDTSDVQDIQASSFEEERHAASSTSNNQNNLRLILPDTEVDDEDGALLRPSEMLSSDVGYDEILPMDLVEENEITSSLGIKIPSATSTSTNMFATSTSVITPKGLPSDGAESQPSSNDNHSAQRQPRTQRPDPQLMERLAEALSVLPKQMQEQIVERIISAITTSNLSLFPPHNNKNTGEEGHDGVPTNVVPHSSSKSIDDSLLPDDYDEEGCSTTTSASHSTHRQQHHHHSRAAATLAALLDHYSAEIKKAKAKKDQQQLEEESAEQQGRKQSPHQSPNQSPKQQGKKSPSNKSNKNASVKTIPVIPVHA